MLWIIERLVDDDVMCVVGACVQIAGILVVWAEAGRRAHGASVREFWLWFTLPRPTRQHVMVRSVGGYDVRPARWEMSPSELVLCPPAICQDMSAVRAEAAVETPEPCFDTVS